jgi:SAM-dependent methyltransferase
MGTFDTATHGDFVSLTEIAGDEVSTEQVGRLARRYYWVGKYCDGADVLEVACGCGQGLGHLASLARRLYAGDISAPLLRMAKSHYANRIPMLRFDAEWLPFRKQAFDVVAICEALYYIPGLDRFFEECRRILRSEGYLLIATANKDLYDFTPSPRSQTYLGVVELERYLKKHGFRAEFWGDAPIAAVGARQRMLRPIKAMASKLGLIPGTMNGKKVLKRLVFGELVKMPAEVTPATAKAVSPTRLRLGEPDHGHKVILCAARVEPDGAPRGCEQSNGCGE